MIRQDSVLFLIKVVIFLFLIYVLWIPFIPHYNKLLISIVNVIMHIIENPDKSIISTAENYLVISRHDMDPNSPTIPAFGIRHLQFSMVLLLTLLLATPKIPFNKRLLNIVIGMILILIYHVFVITDQIFFLYSTNLGEYSKAYYSDFQRNVFGSIKNFNEGVGIYFFPILFWMALSTHYLFPRKSIDKKSIGRNDPCPCGSGKKYKKCCMLTER